MVTARRGKGEDAMRDQTSFGFATTPRILFGPGQQQGLAEALPGSGPVLFVTDPGLTALGLTAPAIAALEARGPVCVFDAVEADPSVATLRACVAAGQAAGVRAVVGFGGGSPMDVAKVAALLLGSGEDLEQAWGVGQARGPRLPLVLVPTTAGTGSEVTPVAILTVAGAEKRGVVSPVLLPDLALLDPGLTVGLPAPATAATGIDAMVHAIEAYTSRAANANPLSRVLACAALDLLGAWIEPCVRDGTDLQARGQMLLGSMLAGQAFANAPVAAVHALAYPLGGHFHIPHGLSNALVLGAVMRFNAPGCAAEYAALAPHVFPDLGVPDPDAPNPGGLGPEGADLGAGAPVDPQARAARFIDALEALSARLGLPARLRDLDIPRAALPMLAQEAMKQTRLLVNNPRALRESDARAIYEAVW